LVGIVLVLKKITIPQLNPVTHLLQNLH